MSWTIQTWEPQYREGVCELFNRVTEHEPHIVGMTPERFEALVERKSYFDAAGLLVAVEEGRVVGWVHGCVVGNTEAGEGPGKPLPRIQMLIHEADRLREGAALVGEITKYLTARSTEEVTALHPYRGYPYYRGLWLGGEPQMPMWIGQMQTVLGGCDYALSHQDLFMAGKMESRPVEPSARLAGIEYVSEPMALKHEAMAQSWTGFEPRLIKAMVNGEQAGELGWVLIEPAAKKLGSPSMNIYNLWTGEKYRRQGIGSALVGRSLGQAYAAGARFMNVCTQMWNGPAQPTYFKHGFVPYGYLCGRTYRPKTGG
ncbi:MAG: GNAT family N-acetyltransferase [Phycisphaeraceae bacterium]|nr:GNAT family N-acetyltransferase [Phycisphaeraceae bacterium]